MTIFTLLIPWLCLAACETPENPEPKQPVYANTFPLIGTIGAGSGSLFPNTWDEDDVLSAVDASDWGVVGEVSEPLLSTNKSGMTVKTNLDAGSSIRVARGIDSFNGTTGTLSPAQNGDMKETALAFSDEVKLSSSFAGAFTLYQPMSYVCVSFSAKKGSAYEGKKISELSFCAPGQALAGTYTADLEKHTVKSSAEPADSIVVKLPKRITLGTSETTVWIAVLPCDLSKVECSVTVAGSVYRFYGENLKPSSAYKLDLGVLGGAVVPKDKSKAEFSKISVEYKQTVVDQSWVTTSSKNTITVDGMNWMDKLSGYTHDRWGGYDGVKPESVTSSNPAGFWRTGKYKGHHVMVNPDGNVTIARGVNGVTPDPYKGATSEISKGEYKARFSSTTEWVTYANKVLSDGSFNFYSSNPNRLRCYREIFSESDEALMRSGADAKQMSQVEIAFLLRTFSWDYNAVSGRSFNKDQGSVFALMFDDKYLGYIDSLAKDVAGFFKDSPNFIGYYTDNELQFRYASSSTPGIFLKQWLALSSSDSKPLAFDKAREYAENFMRDKYKVEPVASNVTTAMDDAFLKDVSEYYYRTATEALRRHDPNHLILGSRLHGKPKQLKIVTAACAKYCDVVSVNVYGVWEPNDDYFVSQLPVWAPDKPAWVTEFYTRNAYEKYQGGLYGNAGEGGGWIVKSQADRGSHYQNFTRKLLTYDYIAGWQWFQMTDDYLTTYGWNNKGIISPKYEYYTGLVDDMRQLNNNIYQIFNYYYDKNAITPAESAVSQAIWQN